MQKRHSEPPPKGGAYIYNKRLQQTLAILDAVRPDLKKATDRLKLSNDKLEEKAK